MITVTIGEKPQTEKPFPKIMNTEDWIGLFIEHGKCIWLTGPYKNQYADKVNMNDITDYNEPITIQNA